MALLALDQGTFNFVQTVQSWNGQGAAPFCTEVRNLATILCHQNFLEAFETGNAVINALPLIWNEVTPLEREFEEQKADSIEQQTEIARLTRSLDLILDAATTRPPSMSRTQDISAPNKFSGDRKTY